MFFVPLLPEPQVLFRSLPPFWLRRDNHFRLFGFTVFNRRFTYVHHVSFLALTRLVIARRKRLSRFASRLSALAHCPVRYFIQDGRFIWWYRWFSHTKQTFLSDLVSHWGSTNIRPFFGKMTGRMAIYGSFLRVNYPSVRNEHGQKPLRN